MFMLLLTQRIRFNLWYNLCSNSTQISAETSKQNWWQINDIDFFNTVWSLIDLDNCQENTDLAYKDVITEFLRSTVYTGSIFSILSDTDLFEYMVCLLRLILTESAEYMNFSSESVLMKYSRWSPVLNFAEILKNLRWFIDVKLNFAVIDC